MKYACTACHCLVHSVLARHWVVYGYCKDFVEGCKCGG